MTMLFLGLLAGLITGIALMISIMCYLIFGWGMK